MTNITGNWYSSATHHVTLHSQFSVAIHGFDGEECYIRKSVSNMYTSYTLRFDIELVSTLETNDYCRIKYSFDGNTFIELQSYQGIGENLQLLDQSFSFNARPGSQLWIQLEADGQSYNGGASCFYDDICLYGHWDILDTNYPTTSPTTSLPTNSSSPQPQNSLNSIFCDDMTNAAFGNDTEWIGARVVGDGVSIRQCPSWNCNGNLECSAPDYSCVEMSGGWGEWGGVMRRSAPNNYAIYVLKFDIVAKSPTASMVEYNSSCRIKYSFGGSTFVELQSYQL